MEEVFEINVYTASFLGILFGFINGSITRFLLKKYINSDNKKFIKVFVFSFFYKLIFLIISIWYLKTKNVIIILLYSVFLIFFQIFIEIYKIKDYGVKRDT